ncbi:hypothetical protein AMK59_7662 [Oryctes borbonicus]|uniref:GTP-binding protein 1 n=1 Tax=Oryctes borbonicus TaxID=1629725 RepID=A0A0T6AWV7_9SCAR|nr:hypothetical protein AMK59_7662 [Oryctes borbonicus]
MESGRTSSVGNDILGFDGEGNVVNKPEHGSLDWVKICEKSSKVITFIDLAGHEKYLKTTVFGMTGHAPDFGMLMIGANAGIIGMTKEHLGLALALSVPVFVVVTKIDMCPSNVLQDNLKMLVRILKSPGCRKVPVMVKTTDDVVLSATNFVSERLCPIFQVSNVNGENLGLLKTFLNLLTTRMEYKENEPAEFQIDDTYSVPGVGTVVSGTTLKGVIKLNDTLMLGPDPLGHFQPIAVKSIHRKRMAVREVRAGQTASFALKKIKRSQIRKGMVMVSPTLNPQACWEFEGEILVLHHPTTISSRYQAMVHCGSIRQTASIISMSQECLRTGDKALIHFRFIKYPEYMVPGQRMVFREGRTKAVGNVVKIFTHTPVSQIGTKSKTNKQQQHYNRSQPSGGGKVTNNHFINASQVPLNTGQSLQQLKTDKKCEYVNCDKTEVSHPGLRLFPFPKDQRFKKWLTNSRCNSFKNLSFEQLHRKYICADHFEDSAFSDSARTKLRRDANPLPYNPKETKHKPTLTNHPVLPKYSPRQEKVVFAQPQGTVTNSQMVEKAGEHLQELLKKCKTGYNPQLFAQLKSKVGSMSEEEKYCNLMFDEMTIDGRLEYSDLLDEIEGFEDFGHFGRLGDIGKEIMLFGLQGIYSDWKLPIAYFVSSSGIKTYLLSKIITETVKRVLETGLKLVSIVSDQGHNNFPATRRLGVTTETPYFEINSQRIYAIFDTPNLFKSIKNNFIGADLLYKDKIVSFRDVTATYNIDKEQNGDDRKLKLTDSHITPNSEEKFQISLALETFSNTVSNYMKSLISNNQLNSSSALNTAEFLMDLNDLFDCLNTRGCDEITNKLIDMKINVQQLFKMTETGPKIPRSFSGLIQTINAILMIHKEQKDLGFNFLPTSRFNVDVLQDFFKSFSMNNTLKGVRAFRLGFRAQCIEDLLYLSKFGDRKNKISFYEANNTVREAQLFATDIRIPEEEIIVYFGGYLLKFGQNKFHCVHCERILQTNQILEDESHILMISRMYGLSNDIMLRNLRKPSDIFLKYIERAQKIFKKVYNDKLRKTKLSEYIRKEIVDVLCSTMDLENCKTHLDYMTKEFVVRRLYCECFTENQTK